MSWHGIIQRHTAPHFTGRKLTPMRSITLPVAMVLVVLAGLLAIALPELYELITSLQSATTGVSTPLSELAGRIPLVLFLIAGIAFTAVLTIAVRR